MISSSLLTSARTSELCISRSRFFPSPDGRGLKVRDLIQRAFFRARFKIPFLLPTREEFMQSFLLQKQILLRAHDICDDAIRVRAGSARSKKDHQ